MSRVHAFDDDALGDLDAVGLVEALRAGTVSATELTEAAIARTERVDPELGAVAHRAWGTARDRAARSDRELAGDDRAPFFTGIPTFVKDNSDVAGMPSQHGTDAFAATPAPRDGDLARMYLGTGMVVLGKTRMSEFGFSASCEHPRQGPVRNPWDLTRTAGASSSGAGALVAAGAVPIAHGNDGGGSIRIPAAANGLVGLKPTRGRIPSDRMNREMPVQIVADGVLTRSVRDTAAFLRESEKIYRNPKLAPVGDITRPSRRRLTIGLVTASIDGPVDPVCEARVREVGEFLSGLGHKVEEIPPPTHPEFGDDFVLYWAFMALAIVRRGRAMLGPDFDRSLTDNLTLGLDRHARHNLHRIPGAIRRLRRSSADAHAVHGRYDVVCCPTLGAPTPELGLLDPTQSYETVMGNLRQWVTFTPLQNANGTPAISLPLACDHDGLPLGVMFAADHGGESTLLGLAYELELTRGFEAIHG